jgi:two-component system NtrC family sensor kinase
MEFEMANKSIREKNPGWLKRNAILVGIVWTFVLAGLLMWNLQEHKKHLLESVTEYARMAYNKDVIYRRWVANHGGVYVPSTAATPPNPYLDTLPHRDVTTTTGMKLTLVNPAYMTRQVSELGQQQYGYWGHITSLKPLRPENRPDPWEKKALTAFETGSNERAEISELGGDRYLRLMRPFVTEKGCLKCHADQGYKLGDIRGGVSTSINLEPILAVVYSHWWDVGLTYLAVWLLGLLGMGFTFLKFGKHFQQLEAQKDLLRQSRDHFQSFYQRAPVPFQSLDGDGRVLEVNKIWLDALGYQLDEVLGKYFADFLVPETVDEWWQRFGRFNSSDQVEGMLLDLKHRDGRIIKGNFYGRMERDEQGTFQRTLCVFYDVTESSKQQETITRLQQRNESILMAAGEGIIGLNGEHKPMFVNPAAAEMLGYALEELLGQDSHKTWHQNEVDSSSHGQNPCQICLAMETRSGRRKLTETLRRRDGTFFPAELIISPMLEGNECNGAVVVLTDISERLEKENRLSLLAAVVEQTDSIVVVFDHQRNITYLNPVFERITGYLVAEAQGKNVHEVFSPDPEHDRSRQELKSCLLRGEVWHGTLQSKKKDGTIFAEETVTFPIRDVHGRIIGYVAIKHDISVQKKLEQQLLQASKMESIGQLAGGVAHDFNNILTVINGYAQIILMKLEKGSKLWHDVREIEKAGERAAGLTRQLLAFSRKQVIMPKAIRVNDEILEMEKMFRRLIGEDVELEFSLAENLPFIYADPSQLQQVLLNLAVNARDALKNQGRHPGKRIKIATSRKLLDDAYVALHSGSRSGWQVQIQVEDNGSGMAKEVADHIFEPFFTTKEVGQGTGMGLATVYGIVKQNQGSIYVYSEPGQGTSFKIYWPLMVTEDAGMELERPEEPASGGSEVILLAEDEQQIREITNRQLQKAGYTVIETEHGLDALEQATHYQGTIDLLFTDVVMPVMGGKELSEKIKEIYPNIPVLFGSGYMDDKIHQDIINLGEDHFVNKPYNIQDIMAKIRRLLDCYLA